MIEGEDTLYDGPLAICAGCDEFDGDPDELKPCAACARRLCADCLIQVGGERFCAMCAVCEFPDCGKGASDSCAGCGRLLCKQHLECPCGAPVKKEEVYV